MSVQTGTHNNECSLTNDDRKRIFHDIFQPTLRNYLELTQSIFPEVISYFAHKWAYNHLGFQPSIYSMSSKQLRRSFTLTKVQKSMEIPVLPTGNVSQSTDGDRTPSKASCQVCQSWTYIDSSGRRKNVTNNQYQLTTDFMSEYTFIHYY